MALEPQGWRHRSQAPRGRRVAGCTGYCSTAQLRLSGLNSFTLPGTSGGGPGSYTVRAQVPNVENLDPNSPVQVNDVTVGNVAKVERQGWHALLTLRINGDVDLPANAAATIGQTSLLGAKHVELAPPINVPPQGKLKDGSLIPLSSGRSYPTTERTLAALSLLLNGGGLGNAQDVTKALSTAFDGREQDLRSLIDSSTSSSPISMTRRMTSSRPQTA